MSLSLESPRTSKSMPKKAGENKRTRKTIVHVVGRPTSMYEDPAEHEEEGEEEPVAKPPPSKKKKLLANATTSQAPSKSKPTAPKKPAATKPKRRTRDIPAAEKNKGSASSAVAAEEENTVLRKLRPHLPEHNDTHLVAEDMKKRKDQGLRKWRADDLYAIRRRTAVDARFHTKEQ